MLCNISQEGILIPLFLCLPETLTLGKQDLAHSCMLEFIYGSEIKYNNKSLIIQDRTVPAVIYELDRYGKSLLKQIYCSLYPNTTEITGQADAELSHNLFQQGLGVNLSFLFQEVSIVLRQAELLEKNMKTSAVRTKIINRWEGGRKVYTTHVWIYGVSILCRAERQVASLVHPPGSPFSISACENLVSQLETDARMPS